MAIVQISTTDREDLENVYISEIMFQYEEGISFLVYCQDAVATARLVPDVTDTNYVNLHLHDHKNHIRSDFGLRADRPLKDISSLAQSFMDAHHIRKEDIIYG